ncbi:hypothetical protein FPRO04_00499 [Fusarium proliferatum]|nr:hypothetical protein FPRO03_00501 [Fusarium proliferatum]KAG4286956.1 hypothetical protein FPRO04_00499 [Fusarium proliferatum]CVK83372.1 uncharacterized protein FPRN_01524 [Fusarium proliferatum]
MADPRAASSLSAYGRRDGPVTPEPPTRFSYDTAERGEPSMNALLHAPLSPERPLAFSDDETLPRYHHKSRGAAAVPSGLQAGRQKRARSKRPQKTQPSSAFLLQEPMATDDDSGNLRRAHRSKSRHKGKDVQEPYLSNGTRDLGLGISSGSGPRARIVSPDTSQEELHITKRNEAQKRGRRAHASQPGAALDVDSTQIVNMALNLSESRRIASRRNISRGNPPRLAPVQDSQTGSNLRAHLQQQRKAVRGASPIPNQSLTPRLPGVRSSSPLRPSPFEATDVSYRYHFSTSTLARAQKAREHLELMAQYRRLLQVLPPLKTGYDRPSASSPPGSPTEGKMHAFESREFMIPLGREYNPLQYIRNRKVRARERMVIDGEKQGFADVESVKDWVNEASERASRELLSSDGSILPPFPGAEEIDSQIATDSAAKVALRVRRPRVDWFFEACDLIADAYWLEQDHHKQLIEDRDLNKIYPQTGETLSRPISGQTDELGTGIPPFITETMEEMNGKANSNESNPSKPEIEFLEPSHRDRARQKLHEMGSFHRQTGSVHHRRFRRRGSSSDDSASEDDMPTEGKARRGTISSRETELLEKQMLEMVARDMRQQRLSHVQETEAEYMQPEDSTSPEPKPQTQLATSREWNMMDSKDSENRPIHNRASLEIPSLSKLGRNTGGGSQHGRNSKEHTDSPQPMSPELAPQYSLSAPPTGLQLSAPSSRSSSPSRNPFTKVKQIFRDKTRDESEEQALETEASSRRPSIPDPLPPTETKPLERHPSNSRPTFESHKHQRSVGSIRPRGDDQVGLRGMFKGPRIDTVIRGGVSRLGDMLWKKDIPMEGTTDVLSSDESDNDQPKGRSRISLNLSRTNSRRNKPEPQHGAKHFLDSMPQFQPMAETHGQSATDVKKLQPSQSRVEVSKVPAPDISGISSPSKPQQVEKVTIVEPAMSEVESCQESVKDGPRISEREGDEAAPMVRFNEPDNFRARKWSIANQAIPQEGQLSKREIARLRTLILTSGIKAMEISRRAQELKKPLPSNDLQELVSSPQSCPVGIPWVDIAKLTPKKSLPFDDALPCSDHFRLARQTLDVAIQTSIEQWQTSADKFTAQTRPKLEERIWCVRSRIADELSGMTREASDQADETGKDLALGQLLKVKHVTDLTDKMMRNRRRRFRWLRRGMWSVVEWVLVGFMWYVWFVVTIFRLFLGLGQGVWQGVRWLLWL